MKKTITPQKYDPPKSSTGDTTHLVGSALLSFVPGAAELFQYFVTPPLEKRRDRWMNEIGEALRRLEENRGVNLEELQLNEMFIDTLLHATQMALRNSQEEKRAALRNAILNAALPDPPEQSLQQMFLNYVDTFTSWHLRVLKFFVDPRSWGQKHGITYPSWYAGPPADVLEHTFTELRGRRDFYDQLVKDLFSQGLMNTDSLHVMMAQDGMFASRSTTTGKKFIEFITSPFNDTDKDPV